jgi:tRNA-splicing ligase RtcB
MRVYVPEGGKPVKVWASLAEQGALDQADNLARLPFAISHVALMPDAHQGYGMPIGGVFFADRAVVPYAIGVDIGCGVVLVQTDLTAEEFISKRDPALAQILRDVPVGNGPHGNHQKPTIEPESLTESGAIQWGWAQKASHQLGSLGGGNHFIEIQADDDDRVYLMLHSGSRSLGKNICDHYHKEALRLNEMWFSALPHRELAYLPFETSEAQQYWQAMSIALSYAVESREHMVQATENALRRTVRNDIVFEPVVDTHHNYAAWENHLGKNGIVHRKGAVRARDGEDVLIPGSMGTFSYWARGLGNSQSFETCQHGAGRMMSRGAARKEFNIETVKDELAAAGTKLVAHDINSTVDEAPGAYKPIDQVMADSVDLVEVVRRLRPLGTVKG